MQNGFLLPGRVQLPDAVTLLVKGMIVMADVNCFGRFVVKASVGQQRPKSRLVFVGISHLWQSPFMSQHSGQDCSSGAMVFTGNAMTRDTGHGAVSSSTPRESVSKTGLPQTGGGPGARTRVALTKLSRWQPVMGNGLGCLSQTES